MNVPTIELSAQKIADRVLDEFEYKGKTIRDWVTMILSSNDLINKNTAIEILKELKENDYERYVHTQLCFLTENQWDILIADFETMLNDIHTEQEIGWIKCSNKMPNDMEKVLYYGNESEIRCGFYNEKYDWWQSGSGVLKSCFVTHWMSLPFPPEDK